MSKFKPTAAQKAALAAFIPSAATFGLAAAMAIVYYTEWKVISAYIPIYNTKYPKPEKK